MDFWRKTYPGDVKMSSQPLHLVQLYGSDESGLTKRVGQYLVEGLRRGDGTLVIATPSHRANFFQEISSLGSEPEAVLFLDAQETLSQFMVRGQPNWHLFETTVGTAMRMLRRNPDYTGFRVYGEMVGILWERGQYGASIQLEKFWNAVLSPLDLTLFCAYPIDVFSSEFQIAPLDALLCSHTHLVPTGKNGDLDSAIEHSMDDFLGRRAVGLRQLMEANFRPSCAVLPSAEARILWIRNNLPDEADRIVERARQYYQNSRERAYYQAQ
jgi:hypothetical protein